MDILAKPNETLLEHTENTLKVLKNIKEAYPNIPKLCEVDDFWNHLFFSLFFHDYGKASTEFQKVLKEEDNNWNYYRHEILSTAFLDSIDLDKNTKRAIGLGIITHHKDILYLEHKFSGLNNKRGTCDELDIFKNNLKTLKSNFDELVSYYSLVPELSEKYLGYKLPKPKTITFEDLINIYSDTVIWYLNTYEDYIDGMDEKTKLHSQYGIFLKGFINTCDYMASGHVYNVLKAKDKFKSLDDIINNLRTTQKIASKTMGSTFIIAPTGSGKTEAALLWAIENQNEIKSKRMFYFLPFTASINKMYNRLQEEFGKDYVGMIHGKSSYFLYKSLSEGTYKEKSENVRDIKNLTKNIYRPYKILTPFQIIKYFFQVKGFEMGLSELANSLLIFDEIHTYDAHTTALILSILKVLKKEYNVEILIMSATMPKFLVQIFKEELNINNMIQLPKEEIDKYTRHSVNILEGNIFDNIDKIKKDLNEKEHVLVICNTIQTAQEIFELLDVENSALLHSRFILKDREKIESKLDSLQLLVGTQALEVSLDISYDVLYTEPAPLDALIQRFGRINRKGWEKNEIKPVNVCQIGSKNDKYIYNMEIVDKTLNLLGNIDILYESKIQELIDEIYGKGYTDKDQEEFQKIMNIFNEFYEGLVPFINNKNNEKDFYKLFKTYEVVPNKFQEEYLKLIDEKKFYEAMSYIVNITHKQFMIQNKKNNITSEENTYFIDVKYDSRLGLQLNNENENIL